MFVSELEDHHINSYMDVEVSKMDEVIKKNEAILQTILLT